MNLKKLEKLLKSGEGKTLDFKREFYEFSGETSVEKVNKTAKFIKDIISFANTIRVETSYIITGFDDSNKKLCGISSIIDDSRLQEKVKDKVRPVPHFSVYEMEYQGKKLGIIEIPIVKYPEPCRPIKQLKGLEKNKIYHRRGSSNSEANEREIVDMHNWLRSLTTALEYTGDGRIIPRLTLIEKRKLLLISLLWFIFLFVYIPSIIYDFNVFKIVSFPYSIFTTSLSLNFAFQYYTNYFLNQKERNKYRTYLLEPVTRYLILCFSSGIWSVVLAAFSSHEFFTHFFFEIMSILSFLGALIFAFIFLILPEDEIGDHFKNVNEKNP